MNMHKHLKNQNRPLIEMPSVYVVHEGLLVTLRLQMENLGFNTQFLAFNAITVFTGTVN